MNKPKITIIVPCYNVEKYITKNILSILSQSYTNFEVIYINDGSNDNTLIILNEYAKKDKRIKIISIENKRSFKCEKFGNSEC